MRGKARRQAVSVPSEIGLSLGNEAHCSTIFKMLFENNTLYQLLMAHFPLWKFLYDISELKNMEKNYQTQSVPLLFVMAWHKLLYGKLCNDTFLQIQLYIIVFCHCKHPSNQQVHITPSKFRALTAMNRSLIKISCINYQIKLRHISKPMTYCNLYYRKQLCNRGFILLSTNLLSISYNASLTDVVMWEDEQTILIFTYIQGISLKLWTSNLCLRLGVLEYRLDKYTLVLNI